MSTLTPPRSDGAAERSPHDDVLRYVDATSALESSRTEVEALEVTDGVEAFNRQLELLKRRLLTEPQAFREMFISDGMQEIGRAHV